MQGRGREILFGTERRHERYSGDSRYVAGAGSVSREELRKQRWVDINAGTALVVLGAKRVGSGDNVERRAGGVWWEQLHGCHEDAWRGLGSTDIL